MLLTDVLSNSSLDEQLATLGECAARCDGWAAEPDLSDEERQWLRRRAASYRQERALLQRGPRGASMPDASPAFTPLPLLAWAVILPVFFVPTVGAIGLIYWVAWHLGWKP